MAVDGGDGCQTTVASDAFVESNGNCLKTIDAPREIKTHLGIELVCASYFTFLY